ncbi:hypothetical protein AAA088_09240 [Hominifimenecus microfluidus]|uniref:DUF6935 domain-containing protein n=1 Tax=Hominifimenecus microfluidus TaxID=2885348 RepID=UPI0032BFE769
MQVIIQKIPENLQEFEVLAAKGQQPECICALFLCALALFERDKEAGTAAMNLLRGPKPMTPYDCQFLRDRLRGKSYLPLAYFEGATPGNNYQPRVPYILNVLADPRPQDVEPGYLRVFLTTSGADSPRPMKLRQKVSTGEWFLWEYSSILSGIRIPVAEDSWA